MYLICGDKSGEVNASMNQSTDTDASSTERFLVAPDLVYMLSVDPKVDLLICCIVKMNEEYTRSHLRDVQCRFE